MCFGERHIIAKLQRIPVNPFLTIGLGATQCSQSAAYTGKCAHDGLISLGATQCAAEVCEFWECLNRAQVQRVPVDRLVAIELFLKIAIWGNDLV